MPSVKTCLWNIQNYGQTQGRYDGLGADGSNDLRNQFVARFVDHHEIDVLMIQEVVTAGQQALADLVTKLNARYTRPDWAYSFCASAIKNNAVDVVTTDADLTPRTGARSECYGVVWRTQSTRFTMIQALHQIARGTTAAVLSPLNISQLGRPTGNLGARWQDGFGATGGFTRDGVYPWEPGATGGYVRAAAWPKLNYPPTSGGLNPAPRWSGSRRPAYVVIRLATGPRTLCPIAAYHAPSKQQLAGWGAYMCGLARELYVVDNVDGGGTPIPLAAPVLVDAGFFGGDFNYSVDRGDWPSEYKYFVLQRGQAGDTGAYQATTPSPTPVTPPPTPPTADRRTTVQILTGAQHATPINSANPNDYLRYKIDLGFHRQVGSIRSARIDLLTEVITPTGPYNTPLVQTAAWMAHLEGHLHPGADPLHPADGDERLAVTGPQRYVGAKDEWASIVCGSWGGTFISWATTRAQFAAHNVTDARRAAEYVHLFVSDHLPLVATIDLV